MDEPPLDGAQQARKEEAERYVLEVIYQGGTILETIDPLTVASSGRYPRRQQFGVWAPCRRRRKT